MVRKNDDYDGELAIGEVCETVIRNVRLGRGVYGFVPSPSRKPQRALFVLEDGNPVCYRFMKYSITNQGGLIREIRVDQAAKMSFHMFSARKRKNIESQIEKILRVKGILK